jgi:hypothetical protein
MSPALRCATVMRHANAPVILARPRFACAHRASRRWRSALSVRVGGRVCTPRQRGTRALGPLRGPLRGLPLRGLRGPTWAAPALRSVAARHPPRSHGPRAGKRGESWRFHVAPIRAGDKERTPHCEIRRVNSRHFVSGEQRNRARSHKRVVLSYANEGGHAAVSTGVQCQTGHRKNTSIYAGLSYFIAFHRNANEFVGHAWTP